MYGFGQTHHSEMDIGRIKGWLILGKGKRGWSLSKIGTLGPLGTGPGGWGNPEYFSKIRKSLYINGDFVTSTFQLKLILDVHIWPKLILLVIERAQFGQKTGINEHLKFVEILFLYKEMSIEQSMHVCLPVHDFGQTGISISEMWIQNLDESRDARYYPVFAWIVPVQSLISTNFSRYLAIIVSIRVTSYIPWTLAHYYCYVFAHFFVVLVRILFVFRAWRGRRSSYCYGHIS